MESRRRTMRSLPFLMVLFFAPLTLILTECATNPATGRRQLNFISTEQEIQIGRESDVQIVRSMGLYPDEGLQQYVSDLGTRLAETSERPELPWTFRVINDDTVNAFALPGGFIYVTRGILAHMDNEAELVGVLGHEIGHVTAQHSANQLSKAQLAQLGLGVATILEPGLANFAPLAGLGIQLMFLKFGREDENQADELGVRYMVRLNADPTELGRVMEMLNSVSQATGGGRIPEWLSTHPNPENRQENIAKAIDELDRGELGAGGFDPPRREEYLRRIDGITYGADPRQGYTVENVFYHPELRFRMDFPSGWQIVNQQAAVIAVNQSQNAAIQLTLSEAGSIREVADALYGNEAVSGSGVQSTRINGLPAATGDFQARTDQGVLRGRATFIEYQDKVFQLIGYSMQDQWSQYSEQVRLAMFSFMELNERRMLDVEPLRIRLVRVDQGTTLEELYNRQNPPVPLAEISLINQIPPDSRLEPGQLVKMVTGRRIGE